jgi:hypothetical protein
LLRVLASYILQFDYDHSLFQEPEIDQLNAPVVDHGGDEHQLPDLDAYIEEQQGKRNVP